MRFRLGIMVAAALALGGCGIDKADEHARQLDVIGDMELSTTFCTSGDTDGGSRACAPFSFAHRGQVLVAYRLPDGSSIPDALTDASGVRHFSRSASYTAYMRDTYPEDGMYWAAYVSDPYSTAARYQNAFTISPDVTLPGPGAPYTGPLRYQVVGGYRQLAGGDDGATAVDCTDTDSTACTATGVADHDALQPTRDLAVLAGADRPAVEAGSHVTVPFDIRFAGSGGEDVTFDLSADTGTPSQTTLVPGSDSHNRVTVDVAVPAGTEPGEYHVTLTATAHGDGDTVIRKVRARRVQAAGVQERSGSMTYEVVAPTPHSPPSTEPPATVAPPPPPIADGPPPPRPAPVPIHAHAPRSKRARLMISLRAPRRVESGTNVSYRVATKNVSRATAVRVRVCTRLPRAVRFDGGRLCFTRKRLRPGAVARGRLVAHIDLDAEGGPTLAHGEASAANAARVHASARMRIVERPATTGR